MRTLFDILYEPTLRTFVDVGELTDLQQYYQNPATRRPPNPEAQSPEGFKDLLALSEVELEELFVEAEARAAYLYGLKGESNAHAIRVC
jgi:hypothetical protein